MRDVIEMYAYKQALPRKGKTAGLLESAEEPIRRGNLVFLDMRADKDVPLILSAYAKKYGHKFRHWTIHDLSNNTPVYYNSLERLSFTNRKPLTDIPFSHLVQSGAVTAFTVAPSLSNTDAGCAVDSLLENLLAARSNLEGDSSNQLNIMLDERNLIPNLDSLVDIGRRSAG